MKIQKPITWQPGVNDKDIVKAYYAFQHSKKPHLWYENSKWYCNWARFPMFSAIGETKQIAYKNLINLFPR
jgi:hypothetical protein